MRATPLISLLLFACITSLSAQNQHPTFVELSEKPHQNKAKQIFKELFGMEDKDALEAIDLFEDQLGFTHQTFQQYYDGIKVDGGTYRLHLKNNHIWYMSGNYFDIYGDLSVTPVKTADAAFNQATNHVGANLYTWEETGTPPEAELVIVVDPDDVQTPRLAYKFDIYASAPLYRAFVYIDAQSGAFIRENLCIHHTEVGATGVSLYNGTVSFRADDSGPGYRLRQSNVQTLDMNNSTIHSQATDITSNTTHFTSDHTAVQAHWGAEQTYNYFLQKHNRNSFDNNGSIIRSYVHYSSNYNNAFWDGQRMTYGDGDGVNFDPLVSIDIVGHEIAHGITDYSANLVYSYESGALNESFSDIFGEAIERYATGSNDWLIGSDVKISGASGIRSMSNPKAFGDPDTYKGTHWYAGSGDNGGVHTNSGVQNKWFYILSEGENGINDLGNSYNVTGIGIEKAAAIAYRNLIVYLSANSNYSDARNGAIQSAIDLYGAGAAEVTATTNAWYAVGIGNGQDDETTYCSSGGGNAAYEWIAGVNVGSFSNTSGAAGYTNFTSKTIELTAGQSYSIALQPGFANTTFKEYWKIWIDYNADGDFNDSGELVFDAGGLYNSTLNSTITIASGTSGNTRMRISMKYNESPSPCENFSYGEVEDYTVSIGSGNGGDTEPPTAPVNLTAFNITQTSADLSWSASSDNVSVASYSVYVNGVYNGNTLSRNYSIDGLSPGTTYTLSVIAQDGAGNKSSASSISVTTLPDDNNHTYCTAQGNDAGSEWIAGVSIGSFSHTSGSAEYSDFTAFTANLMANQTYNIVLTPEFSGATYNEYWRIWIDYNQDGDFEDNGEMVFDAGNASKTNVTGAIKIPENVSGDTRMRVAMRYNTAPSPCGSFNYGEIEDYTVSISNDDAGDTQPPSPPSNLAAVNTTQTTTDLSWSASTDNVGVASYNVYVNDTYHGNTPDRIYTVNGLAPGVTYTLAVTAKDAAGNESSARTIDVTTLNDAPENTYCVSQGNSADAEWIAEVSIGGFSHASGSAGYSDFTAFTANLIAGQSYNISLTPAFSGTIYNEYWRIWIDYNQDGDFEDSGEVVFDSGSPSKTTVTGAMTIPSSANGNTRMRISMKYNTFHGPCGAFNYGEVEDYTVSISNDGGDDDGGGGGATTLFAHYFETGWDGWSDGGSDCFRYSGPFSWEGDYSIRLRDDSGISSAMTSEAYDLSGFTSLKIEYSFYANSMEYGEDFWLLYFDGNVWKTLSVLSSGTSFATDQFHQINLTFNSSDYNFPSNARFRFQCDASTNQDQVYIDAVKVTVSNPAPAMIVENNQATQNLPMSNRKLWEGNNNLPDGNYKKPVNIQLFPNPTQDVLNVKVTVAIETMKIFSANGVLIKEITPWDGTTQINIADLQTGIYYLAVQTNDSVLTRKFVKE